MKGLMNDKLLDRAGVAHLLGITTKTLDRLRKQGGFAKPVMIGQRARWRGCDVQAWIDQKITDEQAL